MALPDGHHCAGQSSPVLAEAFGSRQTTPLHEPEVKARSLATGQDDIPSQIANKLKEASLQRGLILI
jgi:hypothetical protein